MLNPSPTDRPTMLNKLSMSNVSLELCFKTVPNPSSVYLTNGLSGSTVVQYILPDNVTETSGIVSVSSCCDIIKDTVWKAADPNTTLTP